MLRKYTNLKQLLNLIGQAADGQEAVTLGKIVGVIGSRSFGPLLFLAGIILFSPLSGIPGMPTSMGIFVLLIALQLLFRREYFWLPGWLLNCSVARNKMEKSLKWLYPLCGFIDRILQPRLMVFINGASLYLIAIAVCLPIMEFVPFSAHTAGVVLTVFGLSLIFHDGLLALIAFTITVSTSGLVVYKLLLT